MKRKKKKMSFAELLKKARVSSKMKQYELAKKSGLTPAAICNYENGSRKPNYEALIKLSEALSVPLAELVG
jgi:transcriptional regulator with XRE-family HTH domain